MKGFARKILLVVTLILTIASLNFLPAQNPPSPPSHGQGGNQGAPGGGATLEEGVEIALALVAGYGAWLLYRRIRRKQTPSEV